MILFKAESTLQQIECFQKNYFKNISHKAIKLWYAHLTNWHVRCILDVSKVEFSTLCKSPKNHYPKGNNPPMDYLRLFQSFIAEKKSITYIYHYLIDNKIPPLTKHEWSFDSINNTCRALKYPEWRPTHPILKLNKEQQ